MKTDVIIVGMQGGFPDPPDSADVWAVNMGYKIQEGITRMYVMDTYAFNDRALDDMVTSGGRFTISNKQFIEELDALGVPVVGSAAHPAIKMSERYPIEDITEFFGIVYFTSTIAYMMADAIYKGYEHIWIDRIMTYPQSADYFQQKPCMDYWLGQAMARGVKVSISEDSYIGRAFPFDTCAYSYVTVRGNGPVRHEISNVLNKHMEDQFQFSPTDEMPADLYKYDRVERYSSAKVAPRFKTYSKETISV